MKTIASLKGPEFLRAVNKVRHAASAFLSDTGVHDIRKIMPFIPEGTPKEEAQALFEEQSKKNISAILDRLLDEKADQTCAFLRLLIIPETDKDGNAVEPDGMDLIDAGLELFSSPKMMDFFIKLARSVEQTTAG